MRKRCKVCVLFQIHNRFNFNIHMLPDICTSLNSFAVRLCAHGTTPFVHSWTIRAPTQNSKLKTQNSLPPKPARFSRLPPHRTGDAATRAAGYSRVTHDFAKPLP